MFKRNERSPALDLLVGAASLWIAWAFFVDAWSHENEPVETFFTWSHALIYGGMIVLVGALVLLRKSIPAAYRVPLLGVPIFLLGGCADLVWHSFYGIEEGIDIILSPTHETIGFGLMLVASAPIFSAIRYRREIQTLGAQIPLILSLASVLVMIHFATGYALDPGAGAVNAPPSAHDFSADYLTATSIYYYKLGGGVLILLLQSFIIAAFAVFTVTRFDLRPGAMTLLLLLGNVEPTLPFTNASPLLATVAIMSLCGGITADVLLARFSARRANARFVRIFSAAVPAAYVAAYVVVTAMWQGVWWDWYVLTSMVIFAAAIGFGLALLATPQSDTI